MTGEHRSAGTWRPDVERMTRRMAERLQARGCEWPEVAAAALAARGIAGLDRRRWAHTIAVDELRVEAVERGQVTPDDVPPALRDAIDARFTDRQRIERWLAVETQVIT